jgi:23S rRNA (cytidine1920-2'-O)/16S rRNA (cytidine1409-2'-O)-methyltransferase
LRLDNYLVKQGLASSRTKAQNYIKQSKVLVDKKVIIKPSFDVLDQEVELKEFRDYVSRSAFKLAYFLEEIELDLKDKECLDIGSSTGGFSEVLLENGIKSVTCVDVGKEQLHPKIKADKRVKVFEQTDIREFESLPFEVVVSDVSFISLLKILDKIDELSSKDIILLFKPQFEVGITAKRDKKGVVKDKKAIELAKARFEDATKLKGWELIKTSPAQITGKDGNLEYCYYFKK